MVCMLAASSVLKFMLCKAHLNINYLRWYCSSNVDLFTAEVQSIMYLHLLLWGNQLQWSQIPSWWLLHWAERSSIFALIKSVPPFSILYNLCQWNSLWPFPPFSYFHLLEMLNLVGNKWGNNDYATYLCFRA